MEGGVINPQLQKFSKRPTTFLITSSKYENFFSPQNVVLKFHPLNILEDFQNGTFTRKS